MLLYDLPVSDMISADKTSLIADCFAIWRISEPRLFIESLSGNQISVETLLTKVPANALSIYVKPGENKAYWVSKRDAGSVDLW